MRKIMTAIVTIFILVGVNYLLANLLSIQFIDIAFFVGLIGTVIIRMSTSSGGFMSNQMDVQIQGQTGIKMKQQKKHFVPGIAFYTCLGYTIIALVYTFFLYKDYFFN